MPTEIIQLKYKQDYNLVIKKKASNLSEKKEVLVISIWTKFVFYWLRKVIMDFKKQSIQMNQLSNSSK